MKTTAAAEVSIAAESIVGKKGSTSTKPTQLPPTSPEPVSGRSDALAQNINRIQAEEARRIEREEQERLARLREKARLD